MDTTQEVSKQLQYPAITDFKDVQAAQPFGVYFHSLGFDKQQIRFLYACEYSSYTMKRLTEGELFLQKILLDLAAKIKEQSEKPNEKIITIVQIEEELEKYKKMFTQVLETIRMPFTRWAMEKIVKPIADVTNRIDPKENEVFKEIQQGLLQLKIKANAEATKLQAKENEKSEYEAHIKNQLEEIKSDLNKRILTEVNTMYAFYLEHKQEHPDIEALKNTIREMKFKSIELFNKVLITEDDAKEIKTKVINEVGNPGIAYENLIKAGLELVTSRFSMYENDLAQVKINSNSLAEIKQQAAIEIKQVDTDKEFKQAANTMISSASTIPIVMPEGKSLKTVKVVLEENTEMFAINVMAAYTRSPAVRKHLRDRKDWLKLDIKSLVAAINKYAKEEGEYIDTLKYKEETKL